MRRAPALWCFLAAALFGASTPAAKTLVGPMGPTLLAGLLYAGAALCVLPRIPLAPRRWTASPPSRRRLVGAVALGGVLGPVALLLGLQRAPAGVVSLWLSLETVATAVLARFFFREHLGSRGWLAVLLVCIASVALSSQLGLETGAAWVALACVCWGLDNNWTSLVDDYTPEQVTFAKGIATGAILVPLGVALGGTATPRSLLAALAVGALGYGLSLVLYVAGAQQLGATRSQLIFSSAPLFGLVPAWLGLGEAATWLQALALILMGLGLWLLHRDRHAHLHQHPALTHAHLHRHSNLHHDHPHDADAPPSRARGWHQHEHRHLPLEHTHAHHPDLHHRHAH